MVSTSVEQIDIVSLWKDTFGDSEKEIKYFLENCNDSQCVGVYADEHLVSMLILVSCTVVGKPARYIYAACTDADYRKRGCMTELLDYAEKNFQRLCLIPAEEWLIEYYKKRGFRFAISVDEICFNQTEEITEYLFEGCELERPIALIYEGEL